MNSDKPILLVEDDDVDAATVQRALEELHCARPLVHVMDAEQALEYLHDPTSPEPVIILLDLNMPRMNGLELLRLIKQDERLKCIPVIVLTTSRESSDVVESFDQSVAGYVVKPVRYEKFVETMETIEHYWNLSQTPVRG